MLGYALHERSLPFLKQIFLLEQHNSSALYEVRHLICICAPRIHQSELSGAPEIQFGGYQAVFQDLIVSQWCLKAHVAHLPYGDLLRLQQIESQDFELGQMSRPIRACMPPSTAYGPRVLLIHAQGPPLALEPLSRAQKDIEQQGFCSHICQRTFVGKTSMFHVESPEMHDVVLGVKYQSVLLAIYAQVLELEKVIFAGPFHPHVESLPIVFGVPPFALHLVAQILLPWLTNGLWTLGGSS
mmetsp:Transcript_4722/g.9899  ORF Transcript_4722/g.9899 Transcript_4722/m.9899 type:complete len:241 (+) Transcript_4722:839-1561(+)